MYQVAVVDIWAVGVLGGDHNRFVEMNMMKIEPVAELVRDLREPCNMEPGGFECGVCTQAADAIDALQAEVERLTKELEIERMRLAACGTAALGYFKECADAYKSASLDDVLRLQEQLASSQLREKQLREALEFECGGRCNAENNPCNAREVLDSTPTDTTALDRYVKQEQAKMLREMVEDSKSWAMVDSFAGYMRRRADELEGGK